LCIPLGLINARIKDPYLRNFFGLVVGAFLQYACIKQWIYATFGLSITIFFVTKILQRNCALATTIVCFAAILIMHIHRFIVSKYKFYLKI
jgi:hypothetical protein